MYVCLCRAVTDREIQKKIAEGAVTLAQVMDETGAGTCCGCCRPMIQDMLDEASGALPPGKRLPNVAGGLFGVAG